MDTLNDPNTKYTQPTTAPIEDAPSHQELLFFNYHEFLVSDYKSSRSSTTETSLVINHFPNIYAAPYSAMYYTTRIVRIPRIYDTLNHPDLIPQFSLYVPGTEPAALTISDLNFDPTGIFDGNRFGTTSVTPLVPGLISSDQFMTIVSTVNKYLHDALDPYNLYNFLENVLEFLSAGTYSRTFNKFISVSYSKKKLQQLEEYVEEANNTILQHTKCKLISPRKSGYLSVCDFLSHQSFNKPILTSSLIFRFQSHN
jgi:hypothetical protein